jgi:hypothetical protein
MEEVKKLLEISKNIEKIYYDLMQMEYIGFIGNEKFQEKIEYLKLYKDLEKIYIDKINKKYSGSKIFEIIKMINTDNKLKREQADFTLVSSYLVDKNITEEHLIYRRVYNILRKILISKISNDELAFSLEQGGLMKNGIINMYGRNIYILDKAHTLYQMNEDVNDNKDLKYLLFIQLNINSNIYKEFKKHFLWDKYYLSFVSTSLEDVMIEHNFYLSEIKSIEHKENNPLNQELYDYLLTTSSINFLVDSIDRSMELKNKDLKNENKANILLLLIDDALIRAASLDIREDIINFKKDELMKTNDNSILVVKDHLLNTLEATKKDKIYLKS